MDSFFSKSQRELQAAFLTARDCPVVLEYLGRYPHLNLQLLDLVHTIAFERGSTDSRPLVIVAWKGDEVVGAASLQPSLILDACSAPEVVRTLFPFLEPLESGLVKSAETVVTPLWRLLRKHDRHALIDRPETGFWLRPEEETSTELPEGAVLRHARPEDLDALVRAARESLREEGRPDPSPLDPEGFRRWVRGRIQRARVVEFQGSVGFVGYADVQRSEGWLVQGVFTWPEVRRHGLARAGMAGLIKEAFEAGAAHVQLTVVDGNDPATALYRGLGFQPFMRLRTILFQ